MIGGIQFLSLFSSTKMLSKYGLIHSLNKPSPKANKTTEKRIALSKNLVINPNMSWFCLVLRRESLLFVESFIILKIKEHSIHESEIKLLYGKSLYIHTKLFNLGKKDF